MLNPPSEPPADDVAAALDDLRTARRELADAGRVVTMLGIDPPEDGPQARRLLIEQTTAECRCQLWQAEIDKAAARCRALGLDVASVLS
jgi:sugar phosphate isomerase/epimerase